MMKCVVLRRLTVNVSETQKPQKRKKSNYELVMMMHGCKPSTQEAKAKGLQVYSHFSKLARPISKRKKSRVGMLAQYSTGLAHKPGL